MQVQFTCECGQVLRADVGQGGGTVQCPACGKLLSLAGPAAAPYGPRGYVPPAQATTASGTAIAALVFGLCSFIPGLGVLCAPPGVACGLAVLIRKLRGKGLGIAGLVTGLCGGALQVLLGLWVYAVVVQVQQSISSTFAAIATMPAVTTANILDEDIDQALRPTADLPPDEREAARVLAEARRLFAERDAAPGNRYQCLVLYAVHRERRGAKTFEDPNDTKLEQQARDELKKAIREKLDDGFDYQSKGQFKMAADTFGEVMALVPDPNTEVHSSAEINQDLCRRLQNALTVSPDDLE